MNRDLKNAKDEFLAVPFALEVKCAIIAYHPNSLWNHYEIEHLKPKSKSISLKVGYTMDEFKEFLNELDFNYDAGYGSQELFGTIWFNDDTWATRSEYDGSEWWTLHRIPAIPEELR